MKKIEFGILFLSSVILLFLVSGCARPVGPLAPVPVPANTPTPTPTLIPPTPTPTNSFPGWDITNPGSSGASLFTGTYNYQYVHIHSGSGLFLEGPVTINVVQYFTLDSGATITPYGHNTGTGQPPAASLGGGGHGGAGGGDSAGNSGGPVNDNPLNPVYDGSSGGSGTSSFGGGNGGGFLRVNVLNGSVTLDGVVAAAGLANSVYSNPSATYGPGGGSGGSIVIQADTIQGDGFLDASGGPGAFNALCTVWGGGGGGGIILLDYHTADNFTGTYSVAGGSATSPAQPGLTGAFNLSTY